MSRGISMYTLIVLGSAAITAIVCVGSLRRRENAMAGPLALLMGGAAAWAVPHAISFEFASLEHVLLWQQLRYVGTAVVPTAYLIVALRYAGYEEWLSRRVYALLAVVPTVTLGLVWTNHVHELFWRSVSTETVGGATILVADFGPWYWVHIGYSYLLVVGSLLVLARVCIRSGPVYRKQATLMLAGGAIPFGLNVAANVGIRSGPTVDLTTAALALSGVLFALGLFHFELLNVRPIARDRLFEELDDGVIVIDPEGRIADVNSIAETVLEDVAVGQPATGVLSEDHLTDGGELVVEDGARQLTFRVRSADLTDGRGRPSGRIVYLNDVTDLVEREQRISVLNRVLQHNIRNEMSVVIGHLDTVVEHVSDPQKNHIDTARESATRTVGLSRKAKLLERTLRTRKTTVSVSAPRIVGRVVDGALDSHPEATVEIDCERESGSSSGEEPFVLVVDDLLFERALDNLVENAIVHNDAESPRVTVRVESGEERVRIRIEDNGPGIPETERRVLTARTETPLEHGSGLGLWLVAWTVSLSDGELVFETSDSRGSVVALSFRRATA